MQAILQIIMQLMQLMMSQFQGGGGGGYPQPGGNPFGNPGSYGPQQPSPFNYYGGGGGAGGGAYLV